MRIRNKKTGLALALCCLGSFAAMDVSWGALTTQIQVTQVSGVGGLSSSLTSTYYENNVAVNSTTWAGSWNATIISGFIPGGSPTAWQSFCMDFGNTMVSGSTYTYTASTFAAGDPPANDPPTPKWVAGGGAKAGYLYEKHLADITGTPAAQAIARSALAIAIWEVLYESLGVYNVSTYNSSGKGFAVNPVGANPTLAMNLANTWLNAAVNDPGGAFANAPTTTWWKESSEPGDPQSLIGGPTVIPEPSTYVAGLLLGLPILLTGIRSWRKRRSC
jgi:hypothetical protein